MSSVKRWGARIEGGKIVFLPGVAWVLTTDHDRVVAELLAKVSEANAQAEAMRADAERYRWLRERDVCFSFAHDIWRRRDELDAAIDAALTPTTPGDAT